MDIEADTEHKSYSLRDRFVAAGQLLCRGLGAPFVRPFTYASATGNKNRDRIDLERYIYRSSFDMNEKINYEAAGLEIACSFVGGFLAGSVIAATSVPESSYQLIRKSPPQNRPWLERRFGW